MNLYHPTNPKEMRTSLQTMYDRYNLGLDKYPKLRLSGDPDLLPKKTQQVARDLIKAWAIIDDDIAFFEGKICFFGNMMQERHPLFKEGDEHKVLVITRIGRNAIKYGQVERDPETGDLRASIGDFWVNDFVETMQGETMVLTDGRVLTIQDGRTHVINGEPDVAIVRESNVALVMFSDAPEESLVAV